MVALNIGAGVTTHQRNITMRDKRPRNANGQEHGFWQTYGGVYKEFSVHFIDGKPMGYLEYNNVYHLKQNTREYYAR